MPSSSVLIISLGLFLQLSSPNQLETARELLNQGRVSEAVAAFQAIGQPACPVLASIILKNELEFPVKRRLFSVIEKTHGQKSDDAVLAILEGPQPHFRGLAAAEAGRRSLKQAVPKLIEMLTDDAVYMTIVQTDPATERTIRVSDAAITALEAITGKKMKNKTKEEKIRMWQDWWRRSGD